MTAIVYYIYIYWFYHDVIVFVDLSSAVVMVKMLRFYTLEVIVGRKYDLVENLVGGM